MIQFDCECSTWCFPAGIEDWQHHHPRCGSFKTQRFPRPFYYDRACDAWKPVPKELNAMLSLDQLKNADGVYIQFKRVDLTDHEFSELNSSQTDMPSNWYEQQLSRIEKAHRLGVISHEELPQEKEHVLFIYNMVRKLRRESPLTDI